MLTDHKWARNGDKEFRDELTDGPVKEMTINFRFGPSDQLRTVDALVKDRLAPVNGLLKQIESDRGGKDHVLFFTARSPVCHNQNTGESFAWKETCVNPDGGSVVCWEHYDMAYNELWAVVAVKYPTGRMLEAWAA